MKNNRLFLLSNRVFILVFVFSQIFQSSRTMSLNLPAIKPTDSPTGGHLGWPAAPAIDLRSAADAHVTPIGSFKTSIPIEIPPAPGAPSLSLNYDSAMGLGLAGVGWDLSIGWPTLISRDTRFGTPDWSYTNPWVWGGAPLVVYNCQNTGNCEYRTAPDSLAVILINQTSTNAQASVTFPSGVLLTYEAIHYDGQKYPAAPAGAATDVFAFVLKSTQDPNGYLTCLKNKDWINTPPTGRATVLEEIAYGRTGQDCTTTYPPNLPSQPSPYAYVRFSYTDPTASEYYAPISYRLGALVSLNNLLTEIDLYPSGWIASTPDPYASYVLNYASPQATETRQPRLDSVVQRSFPGGVKQERTLRQFKYGNRNPEFGSQPLLLDLGRDAAELPSSLAGSETRPVRLSHLDNPNGIDQIGADQNDRNAPVASALTKQWGPADLNGDGLMDLLVSDERGLQGQWPTYEGLNAPNSPPPAQQWAFINEGIVGDRQINSRVDLTTTASLGSGTLYNPELSGTTQNGNNYTRWIWQEGRGKTRTGMQQSITSPEIREGGLCPPIPDWRTSSDTRIWPYFLDGSPATRVKTELDLFNTMLMTGGPTDATNLLIKDLTGGFIPRVSVSAQLSNWTDLDGNGTPDWVVTPAMIERFKMDPLCLGFLNFGHEPQFAGMDQSNGSDWYRAPIDLNSSPGSTGGQQLTAQQTAGPTGPMGLPLSFSTDYSQGDFFGLTIPVGSLISSAPALANGPYSYGFWQALGNLTLETVSPRPQAGVSMGLNLNLQSVVSSLYSMISTATSQQSAMQSTANYFSASASLMNLDVTLYSGGNHDNSQTRGQLLDFNADGCPDYLLYDSLGHPAGPDANANPGGLLLYLNDCQGGFQATPQRINDGYDLTNPTSAGTLITNEQAILNVRQALDKMPPVDLAVVSGYLASAIACEAIPDPVSRTLNPACIALAGAAKLAKDSLFEAASQASAPLMNSRDTLPTEKEYVKAAIGLSVLMDPAMAFGSPGNLVKLIINARQLGELLYQALVLRAYPSRLNLLSASASYSPKWQNISQPGYSMMVQTEGLVDLNGDSLVDMILTQNDKSICGTNQWEVYWGTGSSNLAAGRGFTSSPTCIDVPQPPDDVRFPIQPLDFDPLGSRPEYNTLPLQVDFSQHNQTGIFPTTRTTIDTDNRVSLLDYNGDARPDLLVAKQDGVWDHNDSANHMRNDWTVYYNNGRGFDLQNFQIVHSVGGSLPGVVDAREVPYPSIKSGDNNIPFVGGERRSSSQVNAAFLDVNADGTADIAERVSFQPTGGGALRVGILYWSRAGSAPQDLLIEELDPLSGAQTLVDYNPAHDFQWKDGEPDGNPPPGGHRSVMGMTAFMVRSVTVKPFSGRSTRATSIGYDYKDPFFDVVNRQFLGFSRLSLTPLDAITGVKLNTAASVVIYDSQQMNGRSGETQERLIAGDSRPASETLYGYTDLVTIPANFNPSSAAGITTSYFSARDDMISVEFPDTSPAVLDLGFDGRQPLLNRATQTTPSLDISSAILFDNHAPTGGALSLNGPSQRIVLLDAQLDLRLPQFTIEAWIKPDNPATSKSQTLAMLPNGYALSIDAAGRISFAAEVSGAHQVLTGELISSDWSHVAASYDGTSLRLFQDGRQVGVLAAPGLISYPSPPSANLRIGCGLDASGSDVDCFNGQVGELRIYPSAWQTAPRISHTHAFSYLMDPKRSDFGLPSVTWNFGDVSDTSDDVYEETIYAQPVNGRVRTAVAKQERRRLVSKKSSDWLGVTHTSFDGLPWGQVSAGNITSQAVYGGPIPVTNEPIPEIVTQIAYTNSDCPGLATDTIDPLGAVTHIDYDDSCAFPLRSINTLGQATLFSYYGVVDVFSHQPVPYTNSTFKIGGRYGQLASTIDPNGAQVQKGYDEWGRPTETFGPNDPHDRPGLKIAYQDPKIDQDVFMTSPAAVTSSAWDDVLHRYTVTRLWGDGQTWTETLNSVAKEDWVISGTQDYDAIGRVIVTYKPVFFSDTKNGCPAASSWCDTFQVGFDPLREFNTVAHVQTAYDSRGRVIRVYGPDVPACGDPSVIVPATSPNLPCDDAAQGAQPQGHYTSFAYPAPGVLRAIDANATPSISRMDLHGRLVRTEEWLRASSQPYSTADYTYDPNGNVTKVVDIKGNTTTASYDALGHKLATDDPDMGSWAYTYDKRGQLLTQTDARGSTTTNLYDPLGRLIRTENTPPPVFVVAKQYTFDGDPADAQVTEPIQSTNLNWHTAKDPASNNTVFMVLSNSSPPIVQYRALFDVDLSGAMEASLSFRQIALSSRCQPSPQHCDVDHFSVWLFIPGGPTYYPLLTQPDLTTTFSDGSNLASDISKLAPIKVNFPQEALGKRFALIFSFGTDVNTPQPYSSGWILDDIRIDKKVQPEPEDAVQREYDSAELASSYADWSPVLDLSFDTQGIVADRSPNQQIVTVNNVKSLTGISGRGLYFSSAATAQVESKNVKFKPFGHALTAEAWVKPDISSTSQSLLSKEGTFEFIQDANGQLVCKVNINFLNRSQELRVDTAIPLPYDAWTHVAMTYDGRDLLCFVNGKAIQSTAPGRPIPIIRDLAWKSLTPLLISGSFAGAIDEVRLFASVLPTGELLAHALSPLRHGPPRGNVLDLTFSDPSSLLKDYSGANNPAQVVTNTVNIPPIPWPGIEGTALQFQLDASGNGSPLVVDSKPSLDSNELSVETWLKTTDPSDRLLIGKWDNQGGPGWRLALDRMNPGHVRFEVITRVSGPDTWNTWSGDTTNLSTNDISWCSSNPSSAAKKLWIAPSTSKFTFDVVGANWDNAIFITDAAAQHLGCNDPSANNPLTIDAVQGQPYYVFVGGNNGAAGTFNVKVTAQREATSTAFVTLETVNNNRWRHVTGTYDGTRIQVYIDGKPAHRMCIDAETGKSLPDCQPAPNPICQVDVSAPPEAGDRKYDLAACVQGSIINHRPLFIGAYEGSSQIFDGMLDEIRLSNYAKRDFEVAASAREYSAYSQALGRPVAMRNRASDDASSYDLLGNLVAAQRRTHLNDLSIVSPDDWFVVRSSFDNLGRTRSLRYPDGEVVVSTFALGGIQTQLIGYGDLAGPPGEQYGKQPYLLSASPNVTGHIAELDFGNGVKSTFKYDEGSTKNPTSGIPNANGTFGNELLSELVTTLPTGEVFQDQWYNYDPQGNLTSRQDFARDGSGNPPGQHQSPLTATYSYDDLGRLTDYETRLGGRLAGKGSYQYDPLGNLTFKEGVPLIYGKDTNLTTCSADAMSQPPHAVTSVFQANAYTFYCYDPNGALAEVRTGSIINQTLKHTVTGKLASLTNAAGAFQFTYDGNGVRMHKVEPSPLPTPRLPDPLPFPLPAPLPLPRPFVQARVTIEPFPFYRKVGNAVEKYYFAAGQRIARRTAPDSSSVFWYHPEHLGGTNLMTYLNPATNKVEELQDAYSEYTPYGSALSTGSNNFGPLPPNGFGGVNTPSVNLDHSGSFQFTGKELDDTGLYDYGARYYDPLIGRFIEPDSIATGAWPQSLNRYSYVLNNPLKYVDPTGHVPGFWDRLTIRLGFKKEPVEVSIGHEGVEGAVQVGPAKVNVDSSGKVGVTIDTPGGSISADNKDHLNVKVNLGPAGVKVNEKGQVIGKVEIGRKAAKMSGKATFDALEGQAFDAGKLKLEVSAEVKVGWLKATYIAIEKYFRVKFGTVGTSDAFQTNREITTASTEGQINVDETSTVQICKQAGGCVNHPGSVKDSIRRSFTERWWDYGGGIQPPRPSP